MGGGGCTGGGGCAGLRSSAALSPTANRFTPAPPMSVLSNFPPGQGNYCPSQTPFKSFATGRIRGYYAPGVTLVTHTAGGGWTWHGSAVQNAINKDYCKVFSRESSTRWPTARWGAWGCR